MAIDRKINQALTKVLLEHRETGYRHHTYAEDMEQYEYIKRGDEEKARAEGKHMFEGPTTGSLSDDPVINYRYLFIASITLACRFCIEGGMPMETAFNISDLYIRRVDKCKSVQEIFDVHDQMVQDYATRMKRLSRDQIFSRPVLQAMDYIDQHLQEPMSVKGIAETVGLSPSYLSTIFKKETGQAVSEYVRTSRIESAKLLLQYTEYSCLEIAEYLCFSSDSHFSRLFKEQTGQTPRQFRKQYSRQRNID